MAYYTSARLLVEGHEVSRFYDDEWFAHEVAKSTPHVYDIYNVNPPTTSLLALPFAGLSYRDARLGFGIASFVAFLAALGLLVRRLPLRGLVAPAFVAFALAAQPVRTNFDLEQAYALVLLLLVLAFIGFRAKRDSLLGAAASLALILKTAGLCLWILPVAARRWKALAWGIAVTGFLVLASLPWVGLGAWRRYASLLPGVGARPETAITAYQTQVGLLRHLFVRSRWSPEPLLEAPAAATILFAASALVIFGLAFWIARSHEEAREDNAFGALTLASVILTPVAADYHYVLALLPIAILLERVADLSLGEGLALVLSLALLGLNLQTPNELAVGWKTLLAYPKLFAAWILFALIVRRARPTAPPTAAP